jgi:hypothetical protein
MMEEIPPPSPIETKPKNATQRFFERIVAWVIVGGFLFGILGAVAGMVLGFFGAGDNAPIGTMVSYFLLGSIFGAVVGLVFGVIGGWWRIK